MADDREDLEKVRIAFRTAHYEISRHATARMLRRDIRTDEIEAAMGRAEIIEDYPTINTVQACSSWDSRETGVPSTFKSPVREYGS